MQGRCLEVGRVQCNRHIRDVAASFNSNVPKWDVSSVIGMRTMFKASFARALCGAWFPLTANKEGMSVGSSE